MEPIDWKKIEHVLLDMDGTLLDLYFDNQFWLHWVPEQYGLKHGLTLAESKEKLITWYQKITGTLNWYCLDYWAKALDLDIVALKHECSAHIRYLPGAIEFLHRLRQQGFAVTIVTNAHPDTIAVKNKYICIADNVERIVSSHEFGRSKEEPGFWQAFSHRYPFDSAKALFVDDSIAVLKAAEAYGIARVIGIACPDSTKDANDLSPICQVDSVAALMPPKILAF